jgi:hypothetical protein
MKGFLLFVTLCLCLSFVSVADANCCTPPQWEGYVTATSYTAQESVSEYVYYDYTNQRLRADAVIVDNSGDFIVESVIERYDLVS